MGVDESDFTLMKQKRHIAFLISDMAAGGAQRVASILCTHWAKQGHKVTLLTFAPENGHSFYPLPPDVTLKNLDLSGGSNNIWKTIPANIKRIRTLRRVYKDIAPDMLIAFMPEGNILGLLSTRFMNDLPVFVSERSEPRIIPKQKIWRLLRRIAYPFADAVICQTPRAAAFFTWHKHAIALPNPVSPPSLEAIPENWAPPEKFIVALGRLGAEKGKDLLIKAFADISEEFPDHHLVLIGDGEDKALLKNHIHRRNLKERVHLIGEHKHPFSIAQRADLYVMPSYFEGFPNALCEAMICGLPVIASHGAAGALDFIRDGENALLFETGSSDHLVEKMRALLTDREQAQALGEQAKKVKGILDPEKICRQWDEEIEKLSSKRI